jgi:two-component system, NtrC family, response regulator AtoC
LRSGILSRSQIVAENTIETVRLLVVSREAAVLRPLWSMGESHSWQLETATNAWEAIERLQAGATPDLFLLDLPHGDGDGLHILRWLRRLRPELAIILIANPDDVAKKQEAIRLGARDCLLRPLQDHQLEAVIRRHLREAFPAIDLDMTSDDVEPVGDDAIFVAASPIMRKVRAQATLLAEANVPVLMLGESGSGKETTARLVHKLSLRSGFEFAKVNCAALPSDLLETELFGRQRNGTSGPAQTKPGKLELCERGTLLLEEITEMPMGLQANLLQVLENKRFVRPGTTSVVEVDVRVLAASTTNIENAIAENRLRPDLYYRLSAYTIHVPPLRQRREEIPLLLRHSMHKLARQYGLSPRTFSPAMIEACRSYSWPGNLRELENFVKRYLMVGDIELTFENRRPEVEDGTEGPALVPPRTSNQPAPSLVHAQSGAPGSDSLKSLVQSVKLEAERNAIAAALDKTGWNRKAAARLLKVSYRTLLYKIEQYRMKSSEAVPFPGGTGVKANGNGFRGNGSAG